MKFKNIKEHIKKHNIKNLVKNCTISFFIIYFVINVSDISLRYFSYQNIINNRETLERYLAGDGGIPYEYENHKKEMIDMIVSHLKVIDYINQHPILSNIDEEEYIELWHFVKDFKNEKNMTVEDIKEEIRKGTNNSASYFYKSKDYTIELFEEMLDLADFVDKQNIGVPLVDWIELLKNILNEENYTPMQVIKELEKDNFEIISEFFEEHRDIYYEIRYPYNYGLLRTVQGNLTGKIEILKTSLAMGICIGLIIYGYSNVKSMKKFVLYIMVIIACTAILEYGGAMLSRKYILTGYNGYITWETGMSSIYIPVFDKMIGIYIPVFENITQAVIYFSVFVVVIKVIANKLTINKLNKINANIK